MLLYFLSGEDSVPAYAAAKGGVAQLTQSAGETNGIPRDQRDAVAPG